MNETGSHRIFIQTVNRPGLAADIAKVFAQNQVNIDTFMAKTRGTEADCAISIGPIDRDRLNDVVAKIKDLEGNADIYVDGNSISDESWSIDIIMRNGGELVTTILDTIGREFGIAPLWLATHQSSTQTQIVVILGTSEPEKYFRVREAIKKHGGDSIIDINLRYGRPTMRLKETYNTSRVRYIHSGRQVLVGDERVHLTSLEDELFRYFIQNAGSNCTYDDLKQYVWKNPDIVSAVVERAVNRLRDKLRDDSKEPEFIANVRGCGYRLLKTPDMA